MSDDKVIRPFPSRELPECAVDIERRMGHCNHQQITLVEHDRVVLCAVCGATLDPFKYLLDGAYAIRRAWQDHRYVEQEVARKRQQIADLDKERKRLAAKVRTLKAKEVDTLDLRKPL